MGLDTTHGCWNGGYGSFHTWREKIAELVEIPLGLMDGYYEVPYWKDVRGVKLGWDVNFENWLPVKWSSLKPDMLHYLLNHSDCDGELEWDVCDGIADRLEAILSDFPDEYVGGHIGNWKEKTLKFIDGLRLAAKKHENVEFH